MSSAAPACWSRRSRSAAEMSPGRRRLTPTATSSPATARNWCARRFERNEDRMSGRELGAIFSAAFALIVGCTPAPPPAGPTADGKSDPAKVRSADVSILFVGNSHTIHHDLPDLVCKMIRFRHPEKTVYSHVVVVPFLDAAVHDSPCREEIETRPWKCVVLQAQRISASGKHDYSRKEGIDIAKLAKDRGAAVFFYSEWGLKDVAGDGT